MGENVPMEGFDMGRKRLPEHERRESITLRLPKWLIQELEKNGDIRKEIEKILETYVKNGKN